MRKEEGGGEEGEARLLDWSPLLVQRGSQDEWKRTEAQTGGASPVRGTRRSPRRCFVASTKHLRATTHAQEKNFEAMHEAWERKGVGCCKGASR